MLRKEARRPVKFMVGPGIWSSASCFSDTLPSRRPVGTRQNGPPFRNCHCRRQSQRACRVNVIVRDRVEWTTYDGSDGVAGGEREHVGAGDDAGALLLDHRLALHHVLESEALNNASKSPINASKRFLRQKKKYRIYSCR